MSWKNGNSYVYWLRGEKFVDLARMSIATVKGIDPLARIHVWTDEPNETPRIKDESVVWHVLESGRPAMVANLDAQIAALEHAMQGDRILFLDADTLLIKPFPWNGTSDMYVTWRKQVNGDEGMAKAQPYNYGVLGVHVRPRILEAFYWMRARILQMNTSNQKWYGNQLALADLVGAPPKDGDAEREVRIRWSLSDCGRAIKVKQLPCEIWNFSPDNAGEDIEGRAILHLKGDRKDLIEHYAARIAA